MYKNSKDKKKKLSPTDLLYYNIDHNVIHEEVRNCEIIAINNFYERLKDSRILAVDIYDFKSRMRWLVICDENNTLCVIDLDKLDSVQIEGIKQLLNSDKVIILKNAKDVSQKLLLHGINISGPFFDLYTAGKVIDSGLDSLNDYDELLKKYLGVSGKSYINWSYGITDFNAKEIGKSLVAMHKLKANLTVELDKFLLADTAKLEFNCLPIIQQLETVGVGFDVEKYKILVRKIREDLKESEEALKKFIGDDYLNSKEDAYKKLLGINKAVSKLLSGQCLEEEQLQEVKKWFQIYKKNAYSLLRYDETFLNYVDSNTQRIYPHYQQIESTTGRIYCSNPNLQQFPRDKKFRECIVPQKGCKFIIADYSQIQLRIAAEISGDSTMIKAFNDSQDIHRLTASAVTQKNIKDISEDERRAAKAINFGLLYGMSGEGLKEYAKNTYSIEFTLEDAEKFKERFFNTYSGVKEWQKSCRQNMTSKECRTLNNRRRIWTDMPKFTEYLNTPVQGTEADILKLALIKLDAALKTYDANIVLIIHDEIIVEVAAGQAEEVTAVVVQCMIEAGQTLLKKVPVEVEVVIADTWAEK